MRLEEEGLVDVFPQHATVVSRVDVGGPSRPISCARRWSSKSSGCSRAAWRSPGHTPRPPIALQQQFAKAGDFESFIAGDNDFHAQLYTAAGKQDLWTLVRSRSGHIDRLRRLHLPSPGKAQNIVRHHKLITRAIEAGDADAAQQHLRKHLSGTLSELDRIRSHYPEYLPTRRGAGVASASARKRAYDRTQLMARATKLRNGREVLAGRRQIRATISHLML